MEAHYIFISTDSVYMASDRSLFPETAIPESASIRPDQAGRIAARQRDRYQYEYGGNKLNCEEVLSLRARHHPGFHFTSLRLCDVIGPCDNLGGFLNVRNKLVAGKRIGTKIGSESSATHRISITFAKDVVTAIVACISARENAWGHAFNVACVETPTYQEFVGLIASNLATSPSFSASKDADMISVDCGPVDISKACRHLGFTPTPLAVAVRETVEWYEDASNAVYTLKLAESSESSSSSSSSSEEGKGEADDEAKHGAWAPAGFTFN
eukprot:CAMPEP_0175958780 /NCGR_PEP_ID=MMETSP0108-20121206/34432_1 /TAXON_ID=195067 ORGANISM="Goniomonas pacifica, Strain CCMP1869" /NCGR_SAMPLE_ID=MMETSP0108 /ASSEMBLY_ACC=CAM_ASM_000204 /LENGTH=268 /DNA_ID=CAMNT_0017286161 /DNA_START=115 /DNA_END=918 /DNA_ORIENTATION=-